MMIASMDDQDLKALEDVLFVSDPGDDGAEEDKATWRRALKVVETLRLMLPLGAPGRLEVRPLS